MFIVQYGQNSKIETKALYHLRDQGVISEPLSNKDRIFLKRLEHVWGNTQFLRDQMKRMPMARRKTLVATADLSTKWERYAMTRYLRQEPGTRLPIKQVAKEIKDIYHLTPPKRALERIRDRARKRRRLDPKYSIAPTPESGK